MLKSKSAGAMGFVGVSLSALLLTAGLALLPWPAGLAEAQQTGGVKNEITAMSVDAYDGRIVVSWENADTDAKHYVRWKLHEVAVPAFRNPCQVDGCDPADGVEIPAGVREYEITEQVIERVKGPILNDYMYEVHLRTEGGSWIDVHSAEPTKKSPGGFLERPGIIAGDGQLELSWNAHESDAEDGQPVGYRVGWHVGNGEYEWADRPGAGEVTLGNISRGPVLSGRMRYTITGLTNGRMYEVRIHTYLAGRPTFSDQDTLRGWPKKGWTPPTAPPISPTPTTEESADGRELLMPPCRQDAEATPEPQPPSGTIAFVLCDDDLTIESVATASGITFYPAFSPDRHNYVVHVADSLEEVKITGRLKRMRFPMWSSKQFKYPGFAWAFVTGESVYDPPGRQVLPSGVTVVASNGATRFEDNNRRTRHVKLSPGITTAEIGGRKWFLRGSPSQSEYEAPGFWDNFWYFYQASEKKAHRTYTLQFVWKSKDTPLEAPAEPGGPTRTVDYDTDDDGLIEVSSLAQLDAMRWDVNGDGYSDHGGPLHDGFPNALLGMGCPSSGCVGYELTTDLDFDTNGSGGADPGDDYWNSGHGWLPIGLDTDAFAAVFEGNGHVIRNLYINSNLKKRSEVTGYVKNTHMWAYHRAAHLGLFEAVAAGGVIRNVGLENADVSRNYACSEEARYLCPQGRASGLVGVNHGKISGSYVTGSVSNIINYSQRVTGSSTPIIAGGLVGFAGSSSVISNSYSRASVSALRDFPDAGMGSEVGGLVGHNDGTIIAAYSTGKVSSNGRAYGIHPAHAAGGLVGDNQGSIKASYSIGALSGRLWRNGLVGRNGGSVTASYWDTQTSGRSSSAGGRGRTTAELQGPTGYTGIYAAWNVDLDGDGNKDDSWEFGTSEQYPVLKDLGAAKQRLGAATQVSKRIDYDADDDGLIEIANLDQLQALSRDMNGKGRPSDFAYSIAYPDPAEGMGCPSSGCVGYELSGDLTFEKGYNLLSSIYGYSAIFEGNNHTIGHLIARGGLFGRVNAGGVVRNLRLDSVSAYGTPGGVVAGVNNGLISNVHVVNSHVGAESIVGGLVGVNGSTGVIVDSSADGNPTIIRIWEEREKKLGGLVGVNRGSIRTSYAVGQVYSGGGRLANEYMGGLVGYNEGSVSASYANGKLVVKSELESEILVTRGGLVGVNEGDITASYSTTRASVFAPFGQTMRTLTGGLVASQVSGTVSNSYWDTQASGLRWSAVGTGRTTAQLQGPTSYSGIYANWHLDLDGDGNKDDPWNFGTSQDYPTLKTSGQAGQTGQEQTTYYVDYVAAPVVVAEGQSAVLTVTLSEPAPAGGVEITATPGYSGSATASSDDVGSIVSPATVAEGDTTLEIAIPTIDDKVDENDETFTVVIASNTAGWVKLGADLATAMVSITDDDTAGVTVTADSPFSVAEAGTNTYTVVLDSQPTADVTVTPTSSDDGAVTVAPASYTFTPGKWDTAATFTVSGVADDDSVDESVSISHRASSQDGKYNSIPVSSVSVAVTESQQQQQVNHAPAVASPIADLDGLPVGHTRQVSLSGVFSYDGAGALTIAASSSDTDVAGVTASTDGSSLTVTGNATGTATIAVVAQDPDGDRATDEFSVTVTGLQEPWNLQVVPGDGAITVTWEASPFYYKERLIGSERIKHALRWWQGSNWANPVGEKAFGRNDGIHVENGVTSYKITGLTNDVPVEVQVRAFFGSNHREGAMNKGASSTSSKWVKAKVVTPQKPNQAPTVSSTISDATIVNESSSSEVSLSGVFADADLDDLTVTASSSSESVATVSVSADYSTLTITAKARGSANVTVTASDGRGGSVEDSFTVTVKAAPVVASAIADVSELEVDATHEVSLSGVFSDADGDTMTVTASSSNDVVATVSVATDQSGLTLTGKAAGTATITVTARDSDGNSVSDAFDATVVKPNSAPTVASAFSNATIVNESGTKQVSLSGVFTDADSDSLTVTASSSDEKVATVSVSADYSGLTVTAKARGTATITVTAKDGNGGSVEDSFTVKVKAAPAVASAIADIDSLVAGTSQEVALTSVFSDADGDTLTLSASSSATAVATVSVATGGSKLTVAGVAEGTATITVTARDSDGNSVSDTFDVTVLAANKAPTVASAISDATIVNTSGTKRVSLSGVFTDADGDSLKITAKSSGTAIATVSVATDQTSLVVSAKKRGTATITVTASDGNGGSVEDSFTVTVKAAPVVASAIADVSELAVEATHEVSMAGVFSDADGDALTISASSSNTAVVQVSNTFDPSTGSATAITVIGVAEGTATVTVTARDTDGNSVSDAFDVTVPVVELLQVVELPGPVVSLAVTASAEDSVTVSWSAPETGGAPQGYIVHIKRKGGGYQDTRRPGANRTQVSFGSLDPGRTYEVWVRAQNDTGKGERVSASITLPESEDTPPAALPGPVAGLELTVDGNTLTVSWSAPETGGAPDGYIVHVSPEDGGKGKTKTPKAMKTQVTFENLDAGRTYGVWVRAQNEAGKGERVHDSITLPQAAPPADQGDGK